MTHTIETVTHELHRIQCDSCPNCSPAAPTRIDALNLAHEAGYRRATRWNGIEHLTRHLCQSCAANAEQHGYDLAWLIEEL